jgi:hypothetical protein
MKIPQFFAVVLFRLSSPTPPLHGQCGWLSLLSLTPSHHCVPAIFALSYSFSPLCPSYLCSLLLLLTSVSQLSSLSLTPSHLCVPAIFALSYSFSPLCPSYLCSLLLLLTSVSQLSLLSLTPSHLCVPADWKGETQSRRQQKTGRLSSYVFTLRLGYAVLIFLWQCTLSRPQVNGVVHKNKKNIIELELDLLCIY